MLFKNVNCFKEIQEADGQVVVTLRNQTLVTVDQAVSSKCGIEANIQSLEQVVCRNSTYGLDSFLLIYF